MKYNITLNQPKMIEHSLNVSQWCILDVLSVAPTWCEIVNFNNINYFWVARQKISQELEAFDFKSDTIFRYLKQLKELGFIDYEKDGKKDLIRLTKLGKSLFTMSEKNPNDYVGKKSESSSEKNPTYNYTNSNNYTDNKEHSLISSFFDENRDIKKDDKSIKIMSDFVTYRKQIKKPIKTTGNLKLYYNKLKELHLDGYDISKCIEEMKLREWQIVDKKFVKDRDDLKVSKLNDGIYGGHSAY